MTEFTPLQAASVTEEQFKSMTVDNQKIIAAKRELMGDEVEKLTVNSKSGEIIKESVMFSIGILKNLRFPSSEINHDNEKWLTLFGHWFNAIL